MKPSFFYAIGALIIYLVVIYNKTIDIIVISIVISIIPCLYILINSLPFKTFKYAKTIEAIPLLDAAFNGNVASFYHRLKRDFIIKITSMIFIVFLSFAFIYTSDLSPIAIAVGILISYFSISKLITIGKAIRLLKKSPTTEQCHEIVEDTYKLDYTAYYDSRISNNGNAVPTSHPLSYKIYKYTSLFFAIIVSIIGCLLTVTGVYCFFDCLSSSVDWTIIIFFSFTGAYPLFIGFRDIAELVRTKKSRLYISLFIVATNIVIILDFILRERPNPW